MKRTIAHALIMFAFLAAAGIPSLAQVYRCDEAAGCVAYKIANGTRTSTNFRKGDLISTAKGWEIEDEEGWEDAEPVMSMSLR